MKWVMGVAVVVAVSMAAFFEVADGARCKNLCYRAPVVVSDQAGGAATVKIFRAKKRPVRVRFAQQWRPKRGAKVRVIARSYWFAQVVRGPNGKVRRTAKQAWHGRRRARGQTRFCWRWIAASPRKVGPFRCSSWRSARLP